MVLRVAISGKQRSGKSFVADVLKEVIEEKGYGEVNICPIAKSLKDMAYKMFGVIKSNECGRKVLQDLAHVGREVDENFWVKNMLENTKDIPNIIVDDLRYTNEAKMLREEGFFLIRVKASKIIREERNGGPLVGDKHQGEIDLDDYPCFDFLLINNGEISNKECMKNVIKEKLGL